MYVQKSMRAIETDMRYVILSSIKFDRTAHSSLVLGELMPRVLPTLVRSDQFQPPLSNFYHHSGLFYHRSQRVKCAEMLCLMQFDSTSAKV